jgi:hypothetical protein
LREVNEDRWIGRTFLGSRAESPTARERELPVSSRIVRARNGAGNSARF